MKTYISKNNLSTVVEDSTVKWIANHWNITDSSEETIKKLAFLEIPFDYAVSYRPGTRFGAKAIIEAFNTYSLYCTDKNVSLEKIALKHYGSVNIVHSLFDSYTAITNAVKSIPTNEVLIALGGDHSITDPILRALTERVSPKELGLIVFDAHFDSREPISGKEHSGHWIKTLEDTLYYPNVVQLGINANIYSEYYRKTCEENGILVKTPYEIRKQGWRTILEKIFDYLSNVKKCYISIDIDCVDQAFAPGTSVPNPMGLMPFEVADAIFEIASHFNMIGFDITEVSPPLEMKNFTSHVAAQFILNLMAGIVSYHNCGMQLNNPFD